MKKNYLFLIGLLFCFQAKAQILNQSANWPNASWTITGTYSTDPLAFESDPTTTANFAFDDDDAGNPHDDDIAAESPVIDLTAAFAGNEKFITVSAQYGYRYLADDYLTFQYWDADGGVWVNWGAQILGNNTTVTNDFCTIPKTAISSGALSIAGFTANQLANFRYRIAYDDKIGGADWNYGFCFDSPEITSSSCGAPSAIAFANIGADGADISWGDLGVAYEYVVDGDAGDPAVAGTPTSSNTVAVSGLTALTTYYVHVRAVCGTAVYSNWTTASFTTLPQPPINDDCFSAVDLTVNPDYSCAVVTAGTLAGATDSGEPDNGAGTPDDDVWFTFVATSTSHRVSLTDVTGTPTDLVHEVLSGGCGGFTSLSVSDPNTSTVGGLVPGETYYVRVFGWGTMGTAPQTTTFNICIGTPPPPPANDNCDGAIALTVNPDLTCAVVTPGDLTSATDSGEGDNGAGDPDDDVWFTFVATNPTLRISLTNVAGTPTNLVHEVLSGSCGGGLTSVLISDPNTSNLTNLIVGDMYYLRVFSFATGGTPNTTFNVCIGTPPAPPVNDLCTDAIPLTVGNAFDATVVAGNNISATHDSADPVPTCDTLNFATNGGDVWYSFIAPDSGSVVIETKTAGDTNLTDTGVEVFAGSCGALTQLGCNADDGDGNFSKLSLTGLNAGEALLVRVYGYNGTQGNFNVSAYDTNLGTSLPESNSFVAVPNPVHDLLTLSNKTNMSQVAVFNLLGQQVISKTLNAATAQVDMSALATGTYIVKVTADNQVKTMKVVKQ